MPTPEQARARFETISPELAPYATRTMPRRRDTEHPINQAYLRDRHRDGSLKHAREVGVEQSDAVFFEQMERIQRRGGISHEGNGELSYTSQVRAEFPEIQSFLERPDQSSSRDSNSNPQSVVKLLMDTGATRLEIYSDRTESDDMRDKRVAQIVEAVSRVERAGFTMPSPMHFYLPKYTRSIKLPSLRTENAWSSFAEFYAPNRIMLSPELLRTVPPANAPRSIAVNINDPSAAIVHEIGHCLHFTQSPKSYSDLFHTRFRQQYEHIAGAISAYGARNPHEFVAETFTAITYNAAIPRGQPDLYRALGGPVPARQTPAPTVGRTLAHTSDRSFPDQRSDRAAMARMPPTGDSSRYSSGSSRSYAQPDPSSWDRRRADVERGSRGHGHRGRR
ncbi:hypothetical protein [Streptomyces daliensis]|uniref:Uncharacterized protein n=1 Tax=Streptomyces daliensis TaxID=299421 RepID=A0A8T4IRH6_9ACTN|nr:hypothetical protein [Streptomyces daliensis]